MRTWQLQDAKARLSEVVKRAEKEGPQGITVHGHSTAKVNFAESAGQLCNQQLSLLRPGYDSHVD
jgi:prevent-host-death family protein